MLNKIADKVAVFIATFAYTGFSPVAPGTLGTLIGTVLYSISLAKMTLNRQVLYTICLLIIGCTACCRYLYIIKKSKVTDPQEITFDEVVAMFICLILTKTILNAHNVCLNFKHYVVLFLLFRFFDVTKIYPISWFDKNIKGVFGIMLDDIIAALFTVLFAVPICFLLK